MNTKTKIWFHGTDSVAARAILREGLKPDKNKFNIYSATMENPAEWEERGFIFITPNKFYAEEFAKYRAAYDRVKVGESFESNWNFFADRKLSGEQYPDAEPVVLELELPTHITPEPDPHFWEHGFRVCGSIPPQYVKAIHEVEQTKSEVSRAEEIALDNFLQGI